MNKLVDVLKVVLCGVLCIVSMVLTACFALSFGSSNADPGSIMAIVSPIILITIGVVIDLSKYIFWGAKEGRAAGGYTLLAAILMVFSWMASVAFFISSEEQKMTSFRKQTPQYAAYETELNNITSLIQQKSELSKKRLDSQFHDQWDKSEELTQGVSELMSQHASLLLKEPTIGLHQAQDTLVSTAFFRSIAKLADMESNTVRNTFYGILALLIEVCAFGLITLCRKDDEYDNEIEQLATPFSLLENNINNLKNKMIVRNLDEPAIESPKQLTFSKLVEKERDNSSKQKTPTKPKNKTKATTSTVTKTKAKKPKKENTKTKPNLPATKHADETRLISDIKTGKVPPTFSQLKTMGYNISQVRIKAILNELREAGVLEMGARNRLMLVSTPLSLVKE